MAANKKKQIVAVAGTGICALAMVGAISAPALAAPPSAKVQSSGSMKAESHLKGMQIEIDTSRSFEYRYLAPDAYEPTNWKKVTAGNGDHFKANFNADDPEFVDSHTDLYLKVGQTTNKLDLSEKHGQLVVRVNKDRIHQLKPHKEYDPIPGNGGVKFDVMYQGNHNGYMKVNIQI